MFRDESKLFVVRSAMPDGSVEIAKDPWKICFSGPIDDTTDSAHAGSF